MNRRVLAGVAVALVLAAILVLSRPTSDPYRRPPLDPRGTGPDGTAALVELLRQTGATVRLGGRPTADDDVVLQLRDTSSGDAADRLSGWVRDGGTLVTTDPSSALGPPTGSFPDAATDRPGETCEVDALADLGRISPPLPGTFRINPSSSSCFAAGSQAGVDVRDLGRGLVVGVASPEPLLNARLGEGDSAVLAVALLVPHAGARVRVLDPRRFLGDEGESGDGTVLGALPVRGREAVTQLVIAFLVWGLVRGRRLGQPVTEELPVPLPASDLVLASGRLLERNGDAADAAERLRRRTRRELGLALGLGPDPVPVQLADALVARTAAAPDLVTAALLSPVTDEAGLVATAAHLDRLRQELHP